MSIHFRLLSSDDVRVGHLSKHANLIDVVVGVRKERVEKKQLKQLTLCGFSHMLRIVFMMPFYHGLDLRLTKCGFTSSSGFTGHSFYRTRHSQYVLTVYSLSASRCLRLRTVPNCFSTFCLFFLWRDAKPLRDNVVTV